MRSDSTGLAGAAIAAVLAFVSCSTTNTAGNRTEVDTLSGKTYTEKGDTYLDGRIQLTDIRYRDQGGFLEIQASVKNLTKDTIQCEYTSQWFDASGWELESANRPWRQLIVHGLEEKEVRDLAPRPGATRVRLAVRRDNAYRP